ncbi:MAG: phasin family protein, partial [Alcaligenes sp.]|nr:phasin family protein [Alcaligenes sp.]
AIPQNVLESQQATLNNLFAAQGQLLQGFEKLVGLNLNLLRSSFEQAAGQSQQAINAKDVQDVVALSQNAVKPNATQALQYGKNVYDIFSDLQLNLSRIAEAQLAQGQQQASEAIDQLAKNAPTGTESAVALLKSSFATASNAAETVVKAARQAADAAESNFQAATNASLKAAAQATEAGNKTVEAAAASVKK